MFFKYNIPIFIFISVTEHLELVKISAKRYDTIDAEYIKILYVPVIILIVLKLLKLLINKIFKRNITFFEIVDKTGTIFFLIYYFLLEHFIISFYISASE